MPELSGSGSGPTIGPGLLTSTLTLIPTLTATLTLNPTPDPDHHPENKPSPSEGYKATLSLEDAVRSGSDYAPLTLTLTLSRVVSSQGQLPVS